MVAKEISYNIYISDFFVWPIVSPAWDFLNTHYIKLHHIIITSQRKKFKWVLFPFRQSPDVLTKRISIDNPHINSWKPHVRTSHILPWCLQFRLSIFRSCFSQSLVWAGIFFYANNFLSLLVEDCFLKDLYNVIVIQMENCL